MSNSRFGFRTRTGLVSGIVVGGAAIDYLLDDFPNAAAAYSLRLLRTAYAGSAIRVRRSSDNAEQDIGFVNAELDTASLLSFVGANNGFVVTWYDQSGNGRHATQTTSANQPQIVSSGSVINVNSKPSIDIISGGVRLDLPNSSYLYNQNQFFGISVTRADATGGNVPTIYAAYTNLGYKVALLYDDSTVQRYQVGGRKTSADTFTSVVDGTNFINQQVLQIGHLNYSTGVATINTNNNSQQVNNSFLVGTMDNTSNSLTADNIGGNSINQFFDGKIQEIIIYPSNQSSNINGFKSNINAYYNIY